jgi:hypothetical protein
LAKARTGLDEARRVAAADAAALARTASAEIVAPPNSLIWSVGVGAEAAVEVGSPVAQWLDCSVMLVDVPVGDAETALIQPGMLADVLIEGESRLRRGNVLMTRGAAATLGTTELVAVAKGRSPGVGQVLVRLAPSETDIARCPIGLSASVDFPELGVLELLRAWLRL